jgi:hypothetical protein
MRVWQRATLRGGDSGRVNATVAKGWQGFEVVKLRRLLRCRDRFHVRYVPW